MSKDKEIKPNTEPKTFIVKITPLVPTASKFVDVETINKGAAEWIALQKLKEAGVDIGHYTCIATEIE